MITLNIKFDKYFFSRSNFGSRGGGRNGWNDDYDGFDGFGSGYGNGFGGGKMGNSGFMGGRNIPYNTRVATHEGDWDCPRSELTSRIFFLTFRIEFADWHVAFFTLVQ